MPSGMGVIMNEQAVIVSSFSGPAGVGDLNRTEKILAVKEGPSYHSFNASWASPTKRGPKECHCLCKWKTMSAMALFL